MRSSGTDLLAPGAAVAELALCLPSTAWTDAPALQALHPLQAHNGQLCRDGTD